LIFLRRREPWEIFTVAAHALLAAHAGQAVSLD